MLVKLKEWIILLYKIGHSKFKKLGENNQN